MDQVSVSDIQQHVITFGIDTFPAIDIARVRTRLNIFYEDATARWGHLYERLEVSDTDFKIKRTFAPSGRTRPSMVIDTLVITPRGPVFVFPVVLPHGIGETGIRAGDVVQRFSEVRDAFFSALGAGSAPQMMRVGMVRDLVFGTSGSFTGILGKPAQFAGAELKAGQCRLEYKDSDYNANVMLQPVELIEITHVAGGPPIPKAAGFGLHVLLDVNNIMVRPLGGEDIAGILERAEALWPEKLLDFVNGLGDKE